MLNVHRKLYKWQCWTLSPRLPPWRFAPTKRSPWPTSSCFSASSKPNLLNLLSLLQSLFRFQEWKIGKMSVDHWDLKSCARICSMSAGKTRTCLYHVYVKSPACVKPRRLKSAILFSRSVVRLAWLSKAGWNYMKLRVRILSPTRKGSYSIGVCNQLLLQINTLESL